jgi:hypothetical protein
MSFVRALRAMCIAVVAASSAHAQDRPSVSFDATLGKGFAWTDGEYRGDRNGISIDALLALRFRPHAKGGVVAGVNAGVHGPWAAGTDAVCIPASKGGCLPEFPTFEMVGALAGWENASTTLRAMAGAAYIQAGATDGWSDWSVAWQARLDGAFPTSGRLTVTGSLRGAYVPNYPRGDAFRLLSLAVGLRIRQRPAANDVSHGYAALAARHAEVRLPRAHALGR